MQNVLKETMDHFGNKPFLKYQAQAFPQFTLSTSYNQEKKDFKKTVKVVPLFEIPSPASIISSHVLYKLEVNDDLSLKLKACIAPHRNEDCVKNSLIFDGSMCPPAGF